MNARRRIAELEKGKRTPKGSEFQPNFEFRVAGMRRVDVIREMMRRLRVAIDDPRATDAQRHEWTMRHESLGQILQHEPELSHPGTTE